MSTGLSRVVAESLATLRAQEPHGRGSEKQWAMTAGRFASAGDRDIDFNIPWAWIYVRHFSCSEEINVRLCTNRHVHFAFHGKTLPVALRAFGRVAATHRLVAILDRIAGVRRTLVQEVIRLLKERSLFFQPSRVPRETRKSVNRCVSSSASSGESVGPRVAGSPLGRKLSGSRWLWLLPRPWVP